MKANLETKAITPKKLPKILGGFSNSMVWIEIKKEKCRYEIKQD